MTRRRPPTAEQAAPRRARPAANAADTAAIAAARRARLETHTAQVQAIILARQDAHTGLLPASTAITVHGDYTHAWVRDNVYSILAVWALALAWRREDAPRAAALEDSVVRLMRGLLAAMTKQAHKVERFKHTQDPLDALHAKYDTRSGDAVVGDDAWGHLQLDATAIFLLFLAQMSASGLKIVRSADEVAFVQNLAHYLAKAYRTPDFGIWERGHKRNEGQAELNASSLGMAKAALEAIDGCRFLPGAAPAIHVAADDVAHARDTLAGLLPRESASKETDAALLAIVGFPAFAVDDEALAVRTRAEIVDKLQGRYGCKRFLRDGHQTVLEDHGRLHYEPGELAQFEHIESEWPLFFTYLLLDAALRGDTALAEDYRQRLESLLQDHDGQRLLPELYFVPAAAVAAERAAPQSQQRVPNENVPLVWAQSLYGVGVLLLEGYIDADALDPLGRRHRANGRPPPCLQIALIAEDALVKSRLAAHGIASETPAEAAPVRVAYAQQLEAALAELGRCDALGLSGRPRDGVGALATGQGFTLGDGRWVFLPSFFDRPGFYLTLDNRLLVDEIAAEIAVMRRHWRGDGQPLLALLVTEPMLDAQGADVLLAFLQSLADADPATTRVGTLHDLWPQAGVTAIDWTDRVPADAVAPVPNGGAQTLLHWEEAATRPLTPARLAALAREGDVSVLRTLLAASRNPYEQAAVLDMLWRHAGPGFALAAGLDVKQATVSLYARAGRLHLWGVLRRAAGLLELIDDSLEDAVAHLVVRGKRIMIGRSPAAGAVIARPCSQAEIAAKLREFGSDDARARVLIQEVVLLLGTLAKADPELLQGTLTVRPWTLVELIIGWLAREHGVSEAEAFDHLLDLSPQAILSRLREVITREQEMTAQLRQSRSLYASGSDRLQPIRFLASGDPARGTGEDSWQVWRQMTGVMTRVRDDFHARVWALCQHCKGIVIGDALDSRNTLDSALVLADTTPSEPAFALRVDDLLNQIHEPAYRQLSIEALLAVSEICRANPQLKIDGWLVVDVLLAQAVALNWRHATGSNADALGEAPAEIEDTARAWQAFYASEPHRVANFVMEAFMLLLHPRQADAAGSDDEATVDATA